MSGPDARESPSATYVGPRRGASSAVAVAGTAPVSARTTHVRIAARRPLLVGAQLCSRSYRPNSDRYTSAPTAPPINGNTMNSQTWASAPFW